MLPALTTHLKPISASLCVLLQTTLARLLPSLRWAAPPDKLFHLSPLVITGGRLRPCHRLLSSSRFSKQRWCVFHTSHCTLTQACEVCNTPVWTPQHRGCDCPRVPWPFFWVLFFQLWQSSTKMALKDMMANLCTTRNSIQVGMINVHYQISK